MTLKQIKYISSFSRELTRKEIDQLIEVAAANNKRDGITGIIVVIGKLFFQIIEGPSKQIDALYARILEDNRHVDVLLLNEEWGVRDRLFPDWSMKRFDLSSASKSKLAPMRALLETIVESRRRIEVLMRTLEIAIWEELTDSSAR